VSSVDESVFDVVIIELGTEVAGFFFKAGVRIEESGVRIQKSEYG
jgi:hypothetical protein